MGVLLQVLRCQSWRNLVGLEFRPVMGEQTMSLVLSRPKKLDHVDTVRYEIDMLRFAAQRLNEKTLTERDAWVYLEVFLLHYRNLIDFLGSENPRSTDLHVTNIWQLADLTPPGPLNELYAKGRALRARYEPTDAQGGGRISQYLQHCTMKRIDAKDWAVTAMVDDIEPLLGEVEKYMGAHLFMLPPVRVKTLDYFSASTTTGTFTSAAVLIDEAVVKKVKDRP
jgi:hypothetical protein